jgi:putative DNA primase/helicase
MTAPIRAPAFLAGLKGWLVWKYVRKDGEKKPRKVPYYTNGHPRTGRQGDLADRNSLDSYENAHALYMKGRYDGIGIAMLGDWMVVALDFDGCVIDGVIHPQVEALLLDTYSEISPSGTGVRAFMRGSLASRKSPTGAGQFGFETFYDTGFVTITGDLTLPCDVLGLKDRIIDVTPEVIGLFEERFGSNSSTHARSGDPLMTYSPKVGLTIAELKALLIKLDPNCGYMEDSPKGLSWIKVGMALHHETDGSPEGLDLFDHWSKGSSDKYPGRAAIEAKWRSFKLTSGSSVTARGILRQVNLLQAKEEGVPVLDPKDAMGCAEMFSRAKFQTDDGSSLIRFKGLWYEYREQCYVEIPDDHIRSDAWQYLGSARKHATNGTIVPAKPTKGQVDGMVDALKAITNLKSSEPPAWLPGYTGPNPRELVSLQNGLLHIPTRQLMPHTPSLFTVNTLPYGWDEKMEPKQWRKFLEQVWPGDPESQMALQEIFGYCLTADTCQQKIFLVIGPRRSGKGTIGRVLSALLGRNNITSPTLTSLTGPFGLQPLIDKLVALVPDARVGGYTNVQAVVERLLMVSGEDMVTADRKNKESWAGTMSARFVFLTNEIPQLGDASGALAGRFITLAIKETFYGREDHGLTNRLLIELPAIFRWAIEGKERLHQRGYFLQPASGEEESDEMAEMSSPITIFVKDMCEMGSDKQVVIADLYNAWRQWCQLTGRTQPGIRQMFGRNLRAAFPHIRKKQPNVDGDRGRVYLGITLKDEL